jgi:hypothetical protein
MKSFYALAVAAVVCLAACSKDDSPKKDSPANVLYSKVLGKWSFGGVVIEARKKPVEKGSPLSRKLSSGLAKEADMGAGFIEFLSDSSYFIYDAAGNVFSGQFSPKDSTSISLGAFGSISNISFAEKNIGFLLTYNGGKTLTIEANKAEPIVMDDRSKLLCRTWYVTKEEAGEALLGWEFEYNDNGHVDSVYIDSVGIQLTGSGTYIVQTFSKKVVQSAEMANWKWDATKSDRFLYWWGNDVPNPETDFVTVRELTSSVLKTSELMDLNGDGITQPDELLKYTLKPAIKK